MTQFKKKRCPKYDLLHIVVVKSMEPGPHLLCLWLGGHNQNTILCNLVEVEKQNEDNNIGHDLPLKFMR